MKVKHQRLKESKGPQILWLKQDLWVLHNWIEFSNKKPTRPHFLCFKGFPQIPTIFLKWMIKIPKNCCKFGKRFTFGVNLICRLVCCKLYLQMELVWGAPAEPQNFYIVQPLRSRQPASQFHSYLFKRLHFLPDITNQVGNVQAGFSQSFGLVPSVKALCKVHHFSSKWEPFQLGIGRWRGLAASLRSCGHTRWGCWRICHSNA
jgi:hypothetical protein